MDVHYYQQEDRFYASDLPHLTMQPVDRLPADAQLTWLFSRDPRDCRSSFCVSDERQLFAKSEDIRFLDPGRISARLPLLPRRLQRRIEARTLQAVNIRHPLWQESRRICPEAPLTRKRVHLLGLGDVGGALLTGLKTLGWDCISAIGIYDLNSSLVQRWVAETSQISWPWDYNVPPKVEAIGPEQLFDCDVFLFAATKSVPAVGSEVADVRMAQFEANRKIVEEYARQARRAGFRGLFGILSDPVDPLCRAAYAASNQDEDGSWDNRGLLAEQIHGFGLGVMNARAADLAGKDSRFTDFLRDGRSFGPHGRGLVIANSIEHYDDAISQELTAQTLAANLRIREMGYKPFVAPALSSGVFQLLLLLRSQWHCASVCLGGVWIGCRNRYTSCGLETEALSMPDALFARLLETEKDLHAIT